jgi:uncharacterized protein (DUF433 family)
VVGGGGGRAEVVVAGEDALVGHALVRGALVVVVALAVQLAAGLDRRVDALAVVGARVLGAGLVVVARAVGVALGGGGGGGRAEVVVAGEDALVGHALVRGALVVVVALAVQLAAGRRSACRRTCRRTSTCPWCRPCSRCTGGRRRTRLSSSSWSWSGTGSSRGVWTHWLYDALVPRCTCRSHRSPGPCRSSQPCVRWTHLSS